MQIRTRFLRLKMCLTLALVLGIAGVASADFTLDAVDTGWYDETGFHDPDNGNYLAGWEPQFSGLRFRNFLVFDTSPISGTVGSATIRMYNPSEDVDLGNGYNSPDTFETFQLSSVATDADLIVSGAGGVDAYNDFGSGIVFGEIDITEMDNGEFVEIELNQAAIDRLNDPLDGNNLLVFGGSVTTLQDPLGSPEFVFGFTLGGANVATLEVTTVTIPEPSTLGILCVAMFAISRRRSARN